MKKVSVKHKSDDSKIDLTPMLDVVFILLFEIGPNNEIVLNRNPRPIIATQIRSNIDQLRAEHPGATVIIQPNSTSDVSTLVLIMDAARQAGIADISIVDAN